MKKILFLIHDLGQGGAEKVLVNLVNHLDRTKYEIHVTSLFGGGVNEQFILKDIKYRCIFKKEFPANSKIMKLFSPKLLHKWFVKENYDIEISYLEGPSARVISGCDNPETKTICWIHSTIKTNQEASASFRSFDESARCYESFNKIICVSNGILNAFNNIYPSCTQKSSVLYNTVESDLILQKSTEKVTDVLPKERFNIIAVGSLKPVKAFDRLLRIHARLLNDYNNLHTSILGIGPEEASLKALAEKLNINESVSFLGYDTNPYKFVANSDLFVCSSLSEGFSTAVTEALIVGTPVCTVEVSGMRELLGENNEWGIICENNENALYESLKKLVGSPDTISNYRSKAKERGKSFSTEETVRAVENMLDNL